MEKNPNNEGAYWEAGFAEGLGKPVIYTCENGFKPHFDVDHNLRIEWDKDNLHKSIEDIKATIRATLPAEAIMDDNQF